MTLLVCLLVLLIVFLHWSQLFPTVVYCFPVLVMVVSMHYFVSVYPVLILNICWSFLNVFQMAQPGVLLNMPDAGGGAGGGVVHPGLRHRHLDACATEAGLQRAARQDGIRFGRLASAPHCFCFEPCLLWRNVFSSCWSDGNPSLLHLGGSALLVLQAALELVSHGGVVWPDSLPEWAGLQQMVHCLTASTAKELLCMANAEFRYRW